MSEKHARVEKHLEIKLEQVEKKLRNVEYGAEFESPESISEIGTFSWHLQTRETRDATISYLIELRAKIQESLKRLNRGVYGICEDCGGRIEEARLNIMPTTTLCVGCK